MSTTILEPDKVFQVAGGKQVWYLSRETLELGPVGHLYASVDHRGYPDSIFFTQFHGLVVHHVVFALSDYDRDGYLKGDLDDVARYMQVLQTAREADLGPEVPYSFVVLRHPDPSIGILCEGRGLGRRGTHTAGHNSDRYGVAIAGNTSEDPITPGVVAAIRWVGAWLPKEPAVATTTGHRDHKNTACPGEDAYSKLHLMQEPFTKDDLSMPQRLLSDTDQLPGWAVKHVATVKRLGILNDHDIPADKPLSAETVCTMIGRTIDHFDAELETVRSRPVIPQKGDKGDKGDKGNKGDRGPRGYRGRRLWPWRTQ